jgi:ABC-type uncharacterized transport system substrate-binding protein
MVVATAPDLIVIATTALTVHFKAATSTIPLVGDFAQPVEAGLVESLARPGGNITGVTGDVGDAIYAKRVDLLRQLVPQLKRVAFLGISRSSGYAGHRIDFAALGRQSGVELVPVVVDPPVTPEGVRRAFATIAATHVGGLTVVDAAPLGEERHLIAQLAAAARLPAIYPLRGYVAGAGGLMSYGPRRAELGRQLALQVAQILKGKPAAEIPVYQPTRFDLAINLATARALGLAVPPDLLAQCDDLIE